MTVAIIIPARHASSRFPGKPLVELRGQDGASRSLVRRTWDAAATVADADTVSVATEDARIHAHVEAFGGHAIMTSPDCGNGTERCAQAMQKLGYDPEIVVNLQGDAPMTPPWFVDHLVAAMKQDPSIEVATPVLRCNAKTYAALRDDRTAGRVGGTTAVFTAGGDALYFSKEVIPHVSSGDIDDTPVYHHVGVYAYRPRALSAYPQWESGPLERAEGLEQLRFLERGTRMACIEVAAHGRVFWELNNPVDIERIERYLE